MIESHARDELPDEKLSASVFTRATEVQDLSDKSEFLVRERV